MDTSPDPLVRAERLAALTARYARFSGSFGGLGLALGGALLLAMCALSLRGPVPPAVRPLVVVAPFAWVIAKEVLRRAHYQRYGRVDEARPRALRATLGAVSLLLAAFFAWIGWGKAAAAWHAPVGVDLARGAWVVALVVAPVALMAAIRSVSEGLVAPYLFFPVLGGGEVQIAFVSSGVAVPAFFAVCAILYGAHEHRAFRTLERDMRASREGALPPARHDHTSGADAPTKGAGGLATVAAASIALAGFGIAALWPSAARAVLPAIPVAYLAVRRAVLRVVPIEGSVAPLPKERARVAAIVTFAFAALYLPIAHGDALAHTPRVVWLGVTALAALFGALAARGALSPLEASYVACFAVHGLAALAGAAPPGHLVVFAALLLVAQGALERWRLRRRPAVTPAR